MTNGYTKNARLTRVRLKHGVLLFLIFEKENNKYE